jgi:hypothetical protein
VAYFPAIAGHHHRSQTKDLKVAQELLQHANRAVTADLYAQGDIDAQRAAQGHFAGLFVVGANAC